MFQTLEDTCTFSLHLLKAALLRVQDTPLGPDFGSLSTLQGTLVVMRLLCHCFAEWPGQESPACMCVLTARNRGSSTRLALNAAQQLRGCSLPFLLPDARHVGFKANLKRDDLIVADCIDKAFTSKQAQRRHEELSSQENPAWSPGLPLRIPHGRLSRSPHVSEFPQPGGGRPAAAKWAGLRGAGARGGRTIGAGACVTSLSTARLPLLERGGRPLAAPLAALGPMTGRRAAGSILDVAPAASEAAPAPRCPLPSASARLRAGPPPLCPRLRQREPRAGPRRPCPDCGERAEAAAAGRAEARGEAERGRARLVAAGCSGGSRRRRRRRRGCRAPSVGLGGGAEAGGGAAARAPEIVPADSKSTLTPQHKACCDVTATIELQGSVELAHVGSGVVEGDLAAIEAYKSSGGDIARQLTADEVRLLNRPSAFDVGYTLVHLAIRFQRQDMLAILLTEVSQQAAKCIPAMVCPELTEQIRREIAASLHQRKGDFACYFLTDLVTFTLPADIEDLPPTVQEKLFDEVLDRDVQKELEEESPIINWSLELATRLDSRLYALWNRTAGDCLLDSVLQATWGIYDKDSVLRKALHDSLHDCSHWFYTRWKDWESWYSQSFGLHFSLREEQWQEDWAFILSLASQPGASLEQTHIFVLAHILRRPIIVYGVKYYKSFRGETLGYTRFQGVYLPLLWEQSFCWKSPIALGYTRGHFSALVAMENDGYGNRGAGANLNTDDDVTITFLPLVDSERKLLHVHFLSAQELGNEEQQEKLLREWLDCCVTEGGVLVAMQKSSRRRNHPLVTQMVEKWLDRYRQIRPCTSLSDGEEDEDDEDE
ncbi:ubiquitin thioesterase ZRANB1 [Moschus berezovskii]|nr:ubiquitin thioesterase ZRANB1 [Moschus berezovskii]